MSTAPTTVAAAIAAAEQRLADEFEGQRDGIRLPIVTDDEKTAEVDYAIYETAGFVACDGECGRGVIEGLCAQRTCEGLFCVRCIHPCHAECGPWD